MNFASTRDVLHGQTLLSHGLILQAIPIPPGALEALKSKFALQCHDDADILELILLGEDDEYDGPPDVPLPRTCEGCARGICRGHHV